MTTQRTWWEKIETKGEEALEQLKRLIAEAGGAWEQAAAHYAASDVLRPDNAAARNRLNDLRRVALAATPERR